MAFAALQGLACSRFELGKGTTALQSVSGYEMVCRVVTYPFVSKRLTYVNAL